jgi:hypothetical protein
MTTATTLNVAHFLDRTVRLLKDSGDFGSIFEAL